MWILKVPKEDKEKTPQHSAMQMTVPIKNEDDTMTNQGARIIYCLIFAYILQNFTPLCRASKPYLTEIKKT